MRHLHYITGVAGTGKTHTIIDALIEWFKYNALADHQKVLAITRMHGSRKRLRERLANKLIRAQLSISTVDSFALHLVNRWRLSLGYSSPILPSDNDSGGFVKDEFGYRATFEEIMEMAARISKSPTVVKTIANSFPIILIDEFQDCTGHQLSLIKNLKGYLDLIVAADPFQSLNGDESACEWAQELDGQDFFKITRLTEPQRTKCGYLHEAANALHENRPAIYRGNSLPFFFAPSYPMAVWKILPGKLLPGETTALIYPVHRSLTNLANSVESQNIKRLADGKSKIPFPWHAQKSEKDVEEKIFTDFSVAVQEGTWRENEKWHSLYDQAHYLSKAKGYNSPPKKFLEFVVKSYVQSRKYVDGQPIRYEATTVHFAKNREFDHVYILWDNNLCTQLDDEQKRRQLYNAITRAKKSCTLVAIGTKEKVKSYPALSLLGEPKEPFKGR